MNYLTMKEAHAIFSTHFDTPKDPSGLGDLMARRAVRYSGDWMPKKRQGRLTVSREQLDRFIAHRKETGAKPAALVVKPKAKRNRPFQWKPIVEPRECEHVPAWDWKTAVYDTAKRNWAASQERT